MEVIDSTETFRDSFQPIYEQILNLWRPNYNLKADLNVGELVSFYSQLVDTSSVDSKQIENKFGENYNVFHDFVHIILDFAGFLPTNDYSFLEEIVVAMTIGEEKEFIKEVLRNYFAREAEEVIEDYYKDIYGKRRYPKLKYIINDEKKVSEFNQKVEEIYKNNVPIEALTHLSNEFVNGFKENFGIDLTYNFGAYTVDDIEYEIFKKIRVSDLKKYVNDIFERKPSAMVDITKFSKAMLKVIYEFSDENLDLIFPNES